MRKEAGARAQQPARAVARQRLDLDHLGAQVGQDHAAGRAHHHVGELDDADAGQRQGRAACGPGRPAPAQLGAAEEAFSVSWRGSRQPRGHGQGHGGPSIRNLIIQALDCPPAGRYAVPLGRRPGPPPFCHRHAGDEHPRASRAAVGRTYSGRWSG